jgi:mannan endo-1,4-beta-mannosidase
VQAPPLKPVAAGDLSFSIDPSKTIGRISPYVYGINSQPPRGFTTPVRRMGGNRQTAYNWEINASSAGHDWKHVNDDWPCTALKYTDCDKPGAQMINFVAENRRAGMDSLLTIPLVDYVSADKRGHVPQREAAPSRRFVRSHPQKAGPYAATPALDDGAVYQDELVHFLVRKFGRASDGGVKFYALDNEPALWPRTHPRVHPKPTTYAEVVSRSEALASAITRIDPSAMVFGGMMFGWSEYMSLSSAPDSKALNAKHGNYLNYYLSSMRRLEQKHQRRLVHVLSIHWYPEPRGTRRITEVDASHKTIAARLQAPRSLWDPEYRERSWITDSWDKPIRLFPWIKEAIAQHYPGTKLAMTEYNYGGWKHISGALAQADVLGIFGREGLFMATYWGAGPGNDEIPPLIAAAFQLYRNYDGKGGKFADTAVEATVEDIAKASIYAATDSRNPQRMTVIVINKDQQGIFQGKLQIAGATKWQVAQVYALDASAPKVRRLKQVAIQNNQLGCTLPPLSATLFVCSAARPSK